MALNRDAVQWGIFVQGISGALIKGSVGRGLGKIYFRLTNIFISQFSFSSCLYL